MYRSSGASFLVEMWHGSGNGPLEIDTLLHLVNLISMRRIHGLKGQRYKFIYSELQIDKLLYNCHAYTVVKVEVQLQTLTIPVPSVHVLSPGWSSQLRLETPSDLQLNPSGTNDILQSGRSLQ